MIYIIGNNREYTREHLESLHIKKNDTVVLCNFFMMDKLPDWKCKYLWAVRNIKNVLKDGYDLSFLERMRFEKVYFVCDDRDQLDVKFASEQPFAFEVLYTFIRDYPGEHPSTGFVMANYFPLAALVGFEDTESYNHNMFHRFRWEHQQLTHSRRMILLQPKSDYPLNED